MSSPLTATERRLIDEAVASGKVKKIPRGKSAYEIVNGMFVEPLSSHPTIRARARKAADRRQKVRDMHSKGLSTKQIAKKLGGKLGTIGYDLVVMNLTPHPDADANKQRLVKSKATQSGFIERRRQERRVKVRALAEQGYNINAIIRALGSSYITIREDIDAMGISITRKKCTTRGNIDQ